jgi:hypothetical protein
VTTGLGLGIPAPEIPFPDCAEANPEKSAGDKAANIIFFENIFAPHSKYY